MTFEEFKILHNRFSKLPLPKEVWQSSEYEQYAEHLTNNSEFYEWTLTEKFKKAQFDFSEFCCLKMADKIFDGIDKNGEIDYDNVDVIMRKWKNGTYGIPIHDGGSSIIEIDYCPWCGKKLNKASR